MQTMLISGETARYELTRLNLHCLQNLNIACGAERVKEAQERIKGTIWKTWQKSQNKQQLWES